MKTEFAGFAAILPADCPGGEQLSVRRIEQQPKIMGVADNQQTVVADGESNGFAGVDFRDPPTADKVPVAVEDLDSPVLSAIYKRSFVVDGDRARFEETTVVQTFAAPNISVGAGWS